MVGRHASMGLWRCPCKGDTTIHDSMRTRYVVWLKRAFRWPRLSAYLPLGCPKSGTYGAPPQPCRVDSPVGHYNKINAFASTPATASIPMLLSHLNLCKLCCQLRHATPTWVHHHNLLADDHRLLIEGDRLGFIPRPSSPNSGKDTTVGLKERSPPSFHDGSTRI